MIALDFDPLLRLGGFDIRWQTLGVAVALLAGVGLAARGRGRAALPLDDMAFILLAAVPGAVLGGRLVHGIVFWEFYSAAPARLLDPAAGSLSLLGAVLGGALTAAAMARLLRAPVRRWADSAAVPLLVALGLGKLAQLLGGSGQGLPFDGPWAVAFVGPGPWISAIPAMPAHPAQVYEGLSLLIGAGLLGILGRPRLTGRAGWLFVCTLTVFLLGRLIVGFSWRDEPLVGPLNAEQLLALLGLAAVALGLAVSARRARYRVAGRSLP
ncbi:MAG TPA: prolipoprotein diacylglyceryl transferase family protein [Candidatus Limnocylindria bacterium]|nr:prolipoprotein diacylglyceryl transferase family protein [Candidatus Limnocylindria bacterium]